jgi:hypothetical protein
MATEQELQFGKSLTRSQIAEIEARGEVRGRAEVLAEVAKLLQAVRGDHKWHSKAGLALANIAEQIEHMRAHAAGVAAPEER